MLSQKVGCEDSAASAVTFHQIWPVGEVGDGAKTAPHIYDNPKHLAKMDTFESFRSARWEVACILRMITRYVGVAVLMWAGGGCVSACGCVFVRSVHDCVCMCEQACVCAP